ncbi:unnamed protein product [Penicillium salamii]|uniref:Lipase B n=1 Tax=Penicillium salamii TaxID=1612424 RepID=A0A9W4IMK0_9EURO|nr:unnamed protein product [Penicillium salamii]CAG8071267.1 unnamed protein product [Penicillium salamii]CAG8250517.1 unnamed protein product [Penicillium salamii]CAG8251240.1 unnamed protein product [Penicillium salamii]CAG8302936.1 unnamed protein product [Penicillium salamii]
MHYLKTAVIFPFFLSALATPVPVADALATRDSSTFISRLENTLKGLGSLTKGVLQEVDLLIGGLQDVVDGKTDPVTTIEEALGSLSDVRNASEAGLVGVAIDLVTKGLAPKNIVDLVSGLNEESINSFNNTNPLDPQTSIFPKSSNDAPYTQSEEDLRAAVYIPEKFKYGADGKQPILLVPGTGDPAGVSYYFNFEKLIPETDFADAIWVNIPNNSLADIQFSSEFIAYAINYVAGITNTTIGVVAASQGNIGVQWALKYWPSARDSVSDFLAISADFHGSLLAEECLIPNSACTPAVMQQEYDSNFIKTLRSDDGDSALVPTTSVYSGPDEVVTPQTDPDASGALKNALGVGATNVQIQLACPGLPAGGFYPHAGLLVNPITWALFIDAMKHDGPADLSRIDLDPICNRILTEGLVLTDLLGTETAVVLDSVVHALEYNYQGPAEEPVIRDYARSSSQ